MKTCPTCGNTFEDDVKFCPDDGTALKAKAQSQDPMMGKRLMDRWEVIDRIGAGGFGTVYKVRDLRFDYLEALKVFDRRKLNPDEVDEAIARFRREAMLLKRLGNLSQNIVGVSNMEDDEEGGFIYFTMELVQGENLSQVLVREGAIHPDRAVAIMKQICKALSVAHNYEEGIVHRDLKLENVMITRDKNDNEVVKILDFGIAKAIGQQSLTNLTMGGPGTPGYAAPEQVEGREIDQRTDLFALGVVFYGMLTGREPWLGGFITEPSSGGWTLLKQSVDGDPIPAHRWDPEIPSQLEEIVFKLLEKMPDNRYQSSDAVYDALVAFEEGKLAPPVAKGTLRVVHAQPGVAIRLKQGVFKTVAEGRTPWEAEGLEPGTYTIQVRDDRYEKETREVEVTAEAAVEVTLTAAAIDVARGSILVETPQEGVRVRLRDGFKSLGEGTTPWEAAHLPPGDYKIEIVDSAYARESRPVRIVANEEAKVQLRPRTKADLPIGEKLKEAAKSPAFLGVAAVAVALAVFVPRLTGDGLEMDYEEFITDYVEPDLISNYEVADDKLIATVITPEGRSPVQVPLEGKRLQDIMRRLQRTQGASVGRGEGELVFEPNFGDGALTAPAGFALRGGDGTDGCTDCPTGEPFEIATGWYTITHSSAVWDMDAVQADSEVYASETLGEDRVVFVPSDGVLTLRVDLVPTSLGRTLGNAQAELRKGTQESLGEARRWVDQALEQAADNPTAIAVRDSIAQQYLVLAQRALQAGDGLQAGLMAQACLDVPGEDRTECGQLYEDARAQVMATAEQEAQDQATQAGGTPGEGTGEIAATTSAADRFVQQATQALARNDLAAATQAANTCTVAVGSGDEACVGIRARVVSAYLARARQDLDARRLDQAENAVQQCLALDANNGQCRAVRANVAFRRGEQALAAGDLDGALSHAQACTRDASGSGAPNCGQLVRSVARQHYETARSAFLGGQLSQADQAVERCRSVDSSFSDCNTLRQALADYRSAQSESQANRFAEARTLANQCLSAVPGASVCERIVERADSALSGPTPAELAAQARGHLVAGRTDQAERALSQCGNDAACATVRQALNSLRTAEQAAQQSNWQQARTAAQQCLSAVSGVRACSDIASRATAAIEEESRPSVTVTNLQAAFSTVSDNRQFQVQPSFTLAGGSGAFCAVARFNHGNFTNEFRHEFQASAGQLSPTFTLDPEGDPGLPRSVNQGNIRYTVTVLIYGQGCGQAPTDGGGEPLDRWEQAVCFYRVLNGQWYANCPVP